MKAARILAAALAACALSAAAAPPATGEQVRAFLGGRAGKLVYLKGFDSQIYFVDFADSSLREKRLTNDAYCLSPMISPDGTRIVYEQGSAIWIRDLVENSPTRSQVFVRSIVPGQTMEPHWWIDPKTKDEYIQYTTGMIDDHEWPPKSGNTYLQKVVANKPSGSPQLLIPYMMSAGRSKNGTWGATSHHSTGMYKLWPEKIAGAFFSSTNWTDFGAVLACNASISPSADPARQNRMLHLHSGGNPMGGKLYDNHKAVVMRSYADADADHPLWWMGELGDRVENDGSGDKFWDSPEWSNDENYFTATGSRDIEVTDTANIYIVRINMAGESKVIRAVSGPGRNHYAHMWIKEGVSPAKIRLDSASLGFAAYKKDTVDPKPRTVTATNAGDGTLPPLAIGPLPKWLKVAITGNGTNTVKLVNTVLRDSVAPGDHQAKVSVTFGNGADSAAYLVSFRYSDPVLTRLRPIPAHAVIRTGDSLRLAALGLDQAGNPMPAPVTVAWEGPDDLKPDADGLFRADTAGGREYLAIARSGALACTTRVTVTRRLLRIDAGAGAGKAEPGWADDAGSAVGGEAGTVPDSLDLGSLIDPAPPGAWRTFRQGYSGYRFPDLPNARYAVRMHFAAARKDANGPTGGLSLWFEGLKLIEEYRLGPGPDTAARAAEVREVGVSVTDGNGLAIQAVAQTGAPVLTALEIWETGVPPVSLAYPNGGESFRVGDTLSIRWSTDEGITSCGIKISVDSGATWMPITRRRSVGLSDKDWRDFRWAIPDTMDGVSLVSSRALISVYDYFGTDRDQSDKPFRIETATRLRPGPSGAAPGLSWARLEGSTLRFELRGRGPWDLKVVDAGGRVARALRAETAGTHAVGLAGLAPGVYRILASGDGRTQSRLLPWAP